MGITEPSRKRPGGQPGPLAIEAAGLAKRFGTGRALDGLDLAVPPGTVYGLLGPNGAGKTTTVRILATLLTPDAGSARVLGHDVAREADAVRRRIALAGQSATTDDDLTGTENLVLLGRLAGLGRKAARARAAELVAAFGLEAAAARQVKGYSGGMRRRLDLAASILVRAEVYFLDEPTTGLDPASRAQVHDIVRSVAADGATVLLTTQYLDEADQLAGRVAVIDHGRVAAEGTPVQLKASVGAGTVRVRLADPAQRPRARHILSRLLGVPVQAAADPATLDARVPAGRPGRRRAVRAGRPGHRDRRVLLRPAQPGRGVPRPHRPRQGTGGNHMTSTVPSATVGLRAADGLAGLPVGPRPAPPGPLAATAAFGWRALLKIRHVPEQLFDVIAIPVVFTLMFTYLFGGALAGSPGRYLTFILPGTLVMAVLLVTMYAGIGLNSDVAKGITDRFRALPIWRAAPIGGALLGDIARYLLAGSLVVVLGVAIGYRPAGGAPGVLAGIGLLLLFALGLSWAWAALGLVARTPQAVMSTGTVVLFPLTLASNVFVAPQTMPGWLQAFVHVNPVSHLVTAERGLLAGQAATGQVAWVLIASAALTAVFAPLTAWLYGRPR